MNARRLLAWTMLLTTACMAPRPCQARPSIRDEVLAPYLKLSPRAAPAKQGIGPAGLIHQTTELPCAGGQWSDEFAIAGLNGTPLCAIFFEGDLVVGGFFAHADGRRVNYIARWDDREWHSLGNGLPAGVRSLAIWRGRLLAAGDFSYYLGGISSLMAWNGVEWEAFSGNIQGNVIAMATNDSDLVISRQTFADGTELSEISRWDGIQWHPMGEAEGQVLALTRYKGEWVAGGWRSNTMPTGVASIARWDGATWRPLDPVLSQTQGTAVVLTMASLAGELIVGGQFDSAGSTPATGIARWNGVRWDTLAGAPPMVTSALIADRDVVHIGHWSSTGPFPDPGNRYLATWDGVSYTRQAAGPEGLPQAIAVDGDRLAVVGWFERVDDRPNRMVAVRRGDRWSPAAGWRAPMRGLTAPVRDFALHDSSLVAVGPFVHAADDTGWVAVNGAARWDGERWREMGQVPGLTWGGDLLVHQGSLYHADRNVRRWNGQSWELVGRYAPPAIDRLASFGGQLWGGGICFFGCAGGLWRYDEPEWVSVPPPAGVPAESSFVTALAVHRGQLVVAWAWGPEYWWPRTRLATWDGTRWQLLPGLFEGSVEALASFRGRLCASGAFATIDAQPFHGFSILESTGWASHGWQCGRGNVMASTDSLLIVGGGRLGFFDGAGWCYLDQANGEIVSLLADGRSLWVGGFFDRVGETPSYSVARWDGLPAASPAPKLASLAAGPNPFRDQVSLYFQLEREARVRLSVLDLMGREIAVLLDGLQSIGEHSIPWTGQDDGGRAAPAGLYFARLEIRGMPDRVRRLVRVQ